MMKFMKMTKLLKSPIIHEKKFQGFRKCLNTTELFNNNQVKGTVVEFIPLSFI